MKEGLEEKVYKIVGERMNRAFGFLTKDATIPFGKEPKPREEQLDDYYNMPPEQFEQQRAESGDLEMEKWLKKMSKITGGL